MPENPPDAVGQPGPGPRQDHVQMLVSAPGALPESDRDLVYTWLLRRGFGTVASGGLASLTGPAAPR